MPLQGLRVTASLALILFACGTATSVVNPDAGRDSGLPSGQCRISADCDVLGSAYFCGARVLPPMCGGKCDAFSGTACQTDVDCADAGAAGSVCSDFPVHAPCYCSQGGAQPQAHCAPGCATAQDCGPGLTCTATHRCVPATCSLPADCGSGNLTCTNQRCVAKPCAKDGDCANYCVTGTCSANLGGCAQAVP